MGGFITEQERIVSVKESVAFPEECPGPELCADCPLHLEGELGICPGCTEEYLNKCLKRICHANCAFCSGGKRAVAPGCCGRVAVLSKRARDVIRRLFQYPIQLHDQQPIQINSTMIPLIHSTAGWNIPQHFPEIDAWIVPIHKISGIHGSLPSRDFKDYFGLSGQQKLILSTCAPDDFQEHLWLQGEKVRYSEMGFDYWLPAHFSIYDRDARLYHFLSAKRQQINATRTGSQFAWFRLGESISSDFLAPVKTAKNILISTGQMYADSSREILSAEVLQADHLFDPDAVLFFIGGARRVPLPLKHKYHYTESNWLIKGLMGRFANGERNDKMTRKEVLIENLKGALANG